LHVALALDPGADPWRARLAPNVRKGRRGRGLTAALPLA